MSVRLESLQRLRRAWRRERLAVHVRGALAVLAAALALVFVDLGFDRLLESSWFVRVLLLAVNACVLFFVARRVWWRHLRKWDPVHVALQVEKLAPELLSVLVSHVQLGGAVRGAGSLRLIEALHGRAELECAHVDFGRIVDFRAIRPAAAASLVVAAALATAALRAPEAFRVFLGRMLDPWSTAAYPTRTIIEGTSGNLVVQEGARVVLAARVAGEVPAEGRLDVRFPDASWETLPARREGGEFTAAIERAARSFQYRFRIGDARSPASDVEVVPPARIVASRVRVVPPAYTKLAPRELDVLNVEAVVGSEILWELRCDRPVTAGAMLREPGEPLALALDPADAACSRARVELDASFGYRFRWTHGPGFVCESAVAHAVKAIPDAPPRVEVVRPEAEEKSTVRREVEIVFRARDDFGLGEAAIVYALNDGPEQRRALGSLADRAADGPMEVRWRPVEALPALKEGDVVRYRIEAADTRVVSGPNVGRSAPLRLAILSVEDYLRHVAERRSRILSGLQGVLREEDESQKNVKMMQGATR